MSAFLKALETYNARKEPSVNPPEAAKVLATATAAEVANEKPTDPQTGNAEPADTQPASTAPVQNVETPKSRTRRSRAAVAPGSTAKTSTASDTGDDPTLTQAIEQVAMLLPTGSEIKIVGRG